MYSKGLVGFRFRAVRSIVQFYALSWAIGSVVVFTLTAAAEEAVPTRWWVMPTAFAVFGTAAAADTIRRLRLAQRSATLRGGRSPAAAYALAPPGHPVR